LDRHQNLGNGINYSLRPCENLQELTQCILIQKEIWGYTERELYPLRLFANLVRIGGHVLGAFTPDQQLVGFVVAQPAWHGRHRYYHSMTLGVLESHRNRGLGRALKLAQRDLALRAGIDCIEWTFDPLRARNANLNINLLGAIVRRYEPNLYGQVDSRMQQGLPSDRLIAEWWLHSPRVQRAITGRKVRDSRKKPAAQVEIPTAVEAVVKSNPEEARKWQTRVREQLQACLVRKLAVTGFVSDQDSAHYLLDPYEN
jgi:predicted GNAT superfamily acetyltransferase